MMSARNFLFDHQIFRSWRAPFPVLAVGNISTGGTGKTPFVDWIVKYYQTIGVQVAIVSRGYKRKTSGTVLVSNGTGAPCVTSQEAGDEPFMLAMKNPSALVVVSEKRKDGIEKLLTLPKNKQPQLVILDDAFQHRQVQRDINFLVIHAAKSPFKDAVLPLGRLRESVSGVDRSDMILISKIKSESSISELKNELKVYGKPILQSRILVRGLQSFFCEKFIPASEFHLHKMPFFAFSGIGDAENFVFTLKDSGIKVQAETHFSDHYDFQLEDIENILLDAEKNKITYFVTTEKDFYRLKSEESLFKNFEKMNIFYLQIEFEIYSGQSNLEQTLNHLAQEISPEYLNVN